MNDGYYYGTMGQGGYTAAHRGSPHRIPERITPNFEHKEGLRHGPFYPAPYLPSVRLEELNYDHFVITAGTPVVLLNDGFAVPAGYRLMLEAAATDVGPQYTAQDAMAGVKNAQGAAVTAGEFVINSMIAASKEAGKVIGVAQYDVFMHLNGDVHNPATYHRHNYNKQNGFAVLTEYVVEFPIEPLKRSAVKQEHVAAGIEATLDLGHDSVLGHRISVTVNKDRVVDFTLAAGAGAGGVDQLQGLSLVADDEVVVNYVYEEAFYAPLWGGMATFRGAAKITDLVTFDADSKFVAFAPSTIGDTTGVADVSGDIAKAIKERENILGHITAVDMTFPKQFLDRVKTAYDDRLYSPIIDPETGAFDELDRLPGSANDGVPHMIQYAGGDNKTGVVRFHLHL